MSNNVNNKRLRKLENKLNYEQIQAAKLVAQNHFLQRAPQGKSEQEVQAGKDEGKYRLEYNEIAERVGVHNATLYKWRKNNTDFINYVNALSEEFFLGHLPEVMNKHLEMTLKGQGSMKGIELFYKFGGFLIDRQEVQQKDSEQESDEATLNAKVEELRKRTKELNKAGDGQGS